MIFVSLDNLLMLRVIILPAMVVHALKLCAHNSYLVHYFFAFF